jgi:hypothetical protein
MKQRILLFLLLLQIITGYSLEPVVFNKGDKPSLIGKKIEYFEDPANSKKVEEVSNANLFSPHKKDVANFALTNSSFWLHFVIRNNSDENNLMLEVGQHISDEIELYYRNFCGEEDG